MSEYPEYVHRDEQPEQTSENIPDETIEAIIKKSSQYGGCPHCGTRQWYPVVQGSAYYWDCIDCGEEITIVG